MKNCQKLQKFLKNRRKNSKTLKIIFRTNCDEYTLNVTRRNNEKMLLLDTMKSCVIIRNTF